MICQGFPLPLVIYIRLTAFLLILPGIRAIKVPHRYFIKLSYAGTAYHGWQVQENTPSTVQQVLNDALSMLLREKIETTGCGRTDTGVHAREFYAHFDCEKDDLQENNDHWVFKLNSVLPPDIAVRKLIKVDPAAHARFDAVARSYQYIIARRKEPFLQGWAWQYWKPLDVQLMNEAAKLLYEFEDFSAFSKSNTQVKTNNCKIVNAEWEEQHDLLLFNITADRFLRNMVRAIVGTLVEVGQGKMSTDQFRTIIEGRSRSEAGASVPGCGLYLVKIEYPENTLGE